MNFTTNTHIKKQTNRRALPLPISSLDKKRGGVSESDVVVIQQRVLGHKITGFILKDMDGHIK